MEGEGRREEGGGTVCICHVEVLDCVAVDEEMARDTRQGIAAPHTPLGVIVSFTSCASFQMSRSTARQTPRGLLSADPAGGGTLDHSPRRGGVAMLCQGLRPAGSVTSSHGCQTLCPVDEIISCNDCALASHSSKLNKCNSDPLHPGKVAPADAFLRLGKVNCDISPSLYRRYRCGIVRRDSFVGLSRL